MSIVDRKPNQSRSNDGNACSDQPVFELTASRDTDVAGLPVRRALPRRPRRKIGAWCFLDHFGPASRAEGGTMDVGPHPHIGLQTVSWLVSGQITHHDSLGYTQVIRPGQLNLMTSGDGISHSEESQPPADAPEDDAVTGDQVLHGVQLWVALPDTERRGPARFEHHPEMPRERVGDIAATVLVGELLGARSPAQVHTPLIGADLHLADAGRGIVPLDPFFEHGVVVLDGHARVDGELIEPGNLAYLGRGRDQLSVTSDQPSRVLLIGGEPLDEDLIMWWNFVGRDWDEVRRARNDWEAASDRFGTVSASELARIPAPLAPAVR